MDLHPSNCEAKLIFPCSVFLEGILSSWLRSVCFQAVHWSSLGYVCNVARGDSLRPDLRALVMDLGQVVHLFSSVLLRARGELASGIESWTRP